VGAANTNFSFIGQPNSIFEVLAADSEDLAAEGVTIKYAFTNTFYDQFGSTSSDNLIMPAQAICAIYEGIVSLAFLGARYRQGSEIYMAAFLNYNPTQ
jgi:hypothetical protein